jgi:paraquat-inducible protein B
MGSKANPAVIGAFVVGAIALAVTGLLVFGSGRMFKHTVKFLCFFPGTVNGLNVGAPVKFKGVEIGAVTDIRIRLEGQGAVLDAKQVAEGIRIPVIIELDNDKLISEGGKGLQDPRRAKELIDLGLRAQLNAQSMVTGLLFIELRFHPDQPAIFVLPPGSKELEIPTIPTSMEQLQSAAAEIIRKLEDMHVETMVESATEALDGVKNVVNAPGLKQTIEALPATIANVNEVLASVRALSTGLDRSQAPLLESLKGTSDKTGATLEQARATLESVQMLAGPNAALAVQLTTSLREVADAAHSVRLLADFLERNPSAIVRGRDGQEK